MGGKQAIMERLEKILGDYKEAIVICDPHAWILLFNPQAKQLFDSPALSIRHSLFGLCHQAPFADAFRLLRQRAAEAPRFGAELIEIDFVCSTIRGATLLNCHMRLVLTDQDSEFVFVLFFDQIPKQIDETGWKASCLAAMIEELRRPLANLNAAAENLKANPDMARDARVAFETVVATESAVLISRFEAVVQESRALTYSQWPLTDIYSSDLIRSVIRKLGAGDKVTATMTGVPLWLHADSHAIMLTLEALVGTVNQAASVSQVDIEVLPGHHKVYCDIVWQGEPVPQTVVDSWSHLPLAGAAARMTVADVLDRHGSDMWCQHHDREGYSRLRIPLPAARRFGDKEESASWPDRPLRPALLPGAGTLAEVADRPLASLAYVVFNTVATGLEPAADTDILEIAGVRVEALRILTDVNFQTLVNPQRPIPPTSVSFHGVTDGEVKGKPPIKVALSQFRAFTGDAILVGHNAALDLALLQAKGEQAKVRFDNMVLDTLLLALALDPEATDHSLDGVCRRLGLPRQGGNGAMATSFSTAQLFLRLIELLATHGITSLGQALAFAAKAR